MDGAAVTVFGRRHTQAMVATSTTPRPHTIWNSSRRRPTTEPTAAARWVVAVGLLCAALPQ